MTRPKPKVADLTTHLAGIVAAGNLPVPDAEAFRTVRLQVKDGPNLRFRGAVAAEYSQRSDRPRYEELTLFLVDGGGFVAARAWHSNVGGESSFWSGAAVATVRECMEAWQWTETAKGFAKQLGWDVNVYVGGGQ